MHSHSHSTDNKSKAIAHQQSKGISLRPPAQLSVGVIQREDDGDGGDLDDNHGEIGDANGVFSSWAEIGLQEQSAFSATTAKQKLIENGVLQGKFVAQLAHVDGDSGPKDYTDKAGNALTDIKYERKNGGYIDFGAPDSITTPSPYAPVRSNDNTDISDPSDGNKLNALVKTGATTATVPTLKNSTRAQHFKVANLVAGTNGEHGASSSPANMTWHHKLSKGKMVLIDRTVHQKHGHNGGKHIW